MPRPHSLTKRQSSSGESNASALPLTRPHPTPSRHPHQQSSGEVNLWRMLSPFYSPQLEEAKRPKVGRQVRAPRRRAWPGVPPEVARSELGGHSSPSSRAPRPLRTHCGPAIPPSMRQQAASRQSTCQSLLKQQSPGPR